MANWTSDECDCPIIYTLAIVGGKWKWIIIDRLFDNKVMRYGELKKVVPHITHKMLSHELKELEVEKLIFREEYHQIPPKVEYSLTEKGKSLLPILDTMCEWGGKNMPKPDVEKVAED
ncbi:winged helix-turn-helix transcriptional regulator [Clostridium lacusfryxellense]|uniref:winged helix-turn-helix transcriptional regulator n=1 Tax=Clostridium lacusfryxellense TaxID=205328 RepID=UPI001C0D7F6F|nr:helix-turn-helix domain-containing protein [Clostridium lacusfryxellense]MBU3113182.1 helix-turn-helix transcriptional regulator [Clostridium lacusfryxellense]